MKTGSSFKNRGLWLALLRRLLTCDALLSRGIIQNPHDLCCRLCFDETESTTHLFFNCRVAKDVCKRTAIWIEISLSEYLEGFKHYKDFSGWVTGKKYKKVNNPVWLAVLWCLWSLRNFILFKEDVLYVDKVLNHIKCLSWGWFICKAGRATCLVISDWWTNPLICLKSI